mgnify:CR=1 FL=1
MKKQKEIIINDLVFTIEYNDIETPVEKINKLNSSQLVWVSFRSKNKISEQVGINILNENESKLLQEISIIIQENNDFYNNFNVGYEFNRRSTNLYRERNRTYIIDMKLYLKIELKN